VGRKVLLIEDHAEIAQLIALHLGSLQCQVDWVAHGEAGLGRALGGRYELVVLDLMLPGRDGLEICRALRGLSYYVPILILSARSGETDRVLGLELGADDYLAKPFSIAELLARVKAIFRRGDALALSRAAPGKITQVGDLVIDPARREARLAGAVVRLTAKEFDLLAFLAAHRGQVFARGQLLDAVWGYSLEAYEHNVNTHINRLRAKIEQDPANPRYVLTVRGFGYRFADA